MDLTALPTQLNNVFDNHTDSKVNTTWVQSEDFVADDSSSARNKSEENNYLEQPTLADIEKSIKNNIDPNAIILAAALSDKAVSWRIHNCKVNEKIVTQELPLAFLYHYDSLDEAIKQANPLTPNLLSQFNSLMTANEVAKLLGIDEKLIAQPWHVKVTGSLVVFSETLQLAVRLNWTNTGKATQQIYTQSAEDAIVAAFNEWHFFGRIDVLYKNDKQALISIDEENVDDDTFISFAASNDYQYLPATHALTVIAKLEAHKSELPWFEAAILERIE